MPAAAQPFRMSRRRRPAGRRASGIVAEYVSAADGIVDRKRPVPLSAVDPNRSAARELRETACRRCLSTNNSPISPKAAWTSSAPRSSKPSSNGSRRSGPPLVVKVGFDPTAPDLASRPHGPHPEDEALPGSRAPRHLRRRVVHGADRRSDRPLEDAAAADAGGNRSERRDLQDADLQDSRSRRRRRSASTANGSSRSAAPAGCSWRRRYNVAQMLERRDFKKRYDSRTADRRPRVPLSARAGLRLGPSRRRRRAGRHRSALQPECRPRHHAGLRPRAAGRDDDAAAGGAGRRREDVEEPRELRRGHRFAVGDVRQADVDLRRSDVALLQRCSPTSRPRSSWRSVRRCRAGELHPEAAKVELASSIVADFHGADAAQAAAQEFERRFSKRQVPDDVAERPMLRGTTIEHLLLEVGFAQSGSDASRKVQQGAVRIDGEKFLQPRTAVDRLGRSCSRSAGRSAGLWCWSRPTFC